MDIQITIRGSTITAPDAPVIVCSNSGYTLIFDSDGEWASAEKRVHITCIQDGQNTEYDKPIIESVLGDYCGLPTLPRCLAVQIYVYRGAGATETRTETLYMQCSPSIRDGGSTAYSGPYDAYNAAMEYANGKLKGTMDDNQLAVLMARLQAHAAMIGQSPSIAYKRAIASMSPETKLDGKMTLANETEIPINNDLLLSSSVGITTNAMRDTYILPGGVPSAELTATIMKEAGIPSDGLRGAELELTFAVRQENGRWGEIPLGVFDIYGIGDDTATGTPVTAYDGMKKLDGIPIPSSGLETGKAYSPHQIIKTLAATAGLDYSGGEVAGSSLGLGYSGQVGRVDFDSDYANNGVETNTRGYVVIAMGAFDTWSWHKGISAAVTLTDEQVAAAVLAEYGAAVTYKGTVVYPSDLPDDAELFDAYRVLYGGPRYKARDVSNSITTARDMLMQTAASVGAFAYMDRHNALQVLPIKKHDATTDIIKPKVLRQRVSRLPYQTFSLTTVMSYYPDGETLAHVEQRTYETLWAEGVEAVMQENPLYPTLDSKTQDTDITQMLINLTHRLDPLTFRPARVETYGDPSIDPWEWISLPTDGDPISVPATEITWKYRGTQTIDSSGAAAVEGLEQSQAEKIIISNKIDASQSSYNEMRDLYGRMMYIYDTLGSFKYKEIEHYTYAQMMRRDRE